jgi:sugar/nucleoside kinase (ribokinase family)
MKAIEAKIKHALENKGIKCQSVYKVPDPDDTRVLISFNSKDNRSLSISKIENALASINVGEFKIPREFQRLSSAFLHLEITLGSRTEKSVLPASM